LEPKPQTILIWKEKDRRAGGKDKDRYLSTVPNFEQAQISYYLERERAG
jgi:hypothetical protein